MRKRGWQCMILFCLLFLCGIPVSAAKQIKPFARMTECHISKKKGVPGDVVKYRFRISASEKELKNNSLLDGRVESVSLFWKNEKGQCLQTEHIWDGRKTGSRHKTSIWVSGKIKIRKGMQGGKWRLDSVMLTDHKGEDGENALIVNRKSAKKSRKRKQDSCYQNLSVFTFKVKTKEQADHEAPTLDVRSMKVGKKQKNGGYKFSIKVKDRSPIERVQCFWHSVAEEGNVTDREEYVMRYNKKTKCYECTIYTLTSGEDSYTSLSTITVWDIYGNRAEYYDSRLAGMGYQDDAQAVPEDFSKMTLYGSAQIREYMEAHPEKWVEW